MEHPSSGLGAPGEPSSSAIVKYNYQAQQLDELSLVKGARILILEKSGDGWWRGQCGNKVTKIVDIVKKYYEDPITVLVWYSRGR